MGIPGSANPMLFGGTAAYQINQSLRFNSADSAGLTRTQTTNNESSDFTISFWVKKAYNGDNNMMLLHLDNGSVYSYISFGESTSDEDLLTARGTASGYAFRTDRKYRDNSAWYHVVLSVDAGTITKGWINGVLDRDTGATSGWRFNGAYTIGMGRTAAGSNYLNGYLAEWHFVDGQALTAADFGETDPITGAWIPKKYSGSYGTNGYYLKFDPSATNGIGHDHSGNGNNWTASGFSTSGTGTDVMSDTPTNNYCTLNPLNTYNNNTSNGNLSYSQTNSNNAVSQGTIGMPSGKWYWEINAANVGNGVYGITRYEYPTQAVFGCSNGYGTGFSPALNEAYINSSTASSSYCSSPSAPASGTYMFAFDADARKFWMGVNGTWYTKTGGSAGDPGAGTNELFGTSDITAGVVYRALIGGSAVTTVSGDINFGQRAFAYTPPTGFKALNTANLPEPTIKKGGKYFNTVLYTGNGISSPQAVTGVGFQPDLVWIKARSFAGAHKLVDAVRGADKFLESSSTAAESTTALNSFDSDGFTITGSSGFNNGTETFVAWNWDANGAGSSNTAGTITSTVSANASAGFSIVTYTGNSTAGATVGHGLGVAPKMIITKCRQFTSEWAVYHESVGNTGALFLNQDYNTQTSSAYWNNTSPSSSLFTLGGGSTTNNTGTYVAYCFSEVASFSKFGIYTGNGSSDGVFVHCGFRVGWLLVKKTNASGTSWYIWDNKRDPYNVVHWRLLPNDSGGDRGTVDTTVDFLSNGFKFRDGDTGWNSSGDTFIYAAFAELPFKYANAR